MKPLSRLSWSLLERLSTKRRDEVQKRGGGEAVGRRVDLKGLDGGLKCVLGVGGGGGSLLLLSFSLFK